MSGNPSSSSEYEFTRLTSGSFSHSHNTKKNGPNIIQYKPDGVSGIFAPKIIIHGKSYSANSGLNDLNSQPEASNSHSHSIMYPIYPNNPTVSNSRQNALNEHAVSSSNLDLYGDIMNNIFNDDNSVQASDLDPTFFTKLNDCTLDKNGHAMLLSKCNTEDRIEIIKKSTNPGEEAIVCCKENNYKGLNQYGDGARAGWGQGYGNQQSASGGSASGGSASGGSASGGSGSGGSGSGGSGSGGSGSGSGGSGSGSGGSGSGGSGSSGSMPQNLGSLKQRWNALTTKNNSVCRTFCDNDVDLIERKTGTKEDYCLKSNKTDLNDDCLNKYDYRPITQPCIDNYCKNYQAKKLKKWNPNEVAVRVFGKKQYALKEDPKFIKKDTYQNNIIASKKPAGVQLNCKDNKNCCHDARDKTECNQREDCRYCDSGNSEKTVCYRILDSSDNPIKLSGTNKPIYLCDTGQGACVPTYGTNNTPDLRHPYDNPNDTVYKVKDTKRHYEGNTPLPVIHHHVIDYPLTCENSGYDFSGSYNNSRAAYNSQQGGIKESALRQYCRDNCPKDLSGNWLYPNSCSMCD